MEPVGMHDVPSWGGPPAAQWSLDVIRGGVALEPIDLNAAARRQDAAEGSWVLVGRDADACTLAPQHPSTSRHHAVFQFRASRSGGGDDNNVSDGNGSEADAVNTADVTEALFLKDLASTHGTLRNKSALGSSSGSGGGAWVELSVGDVLRFGASSRLYIVEGPAAARPDAVESDRLRSLRRRYQHCIL